MCFSFTTVEKIKRPPHILGISSHIVAHQIFLEASQLWIKGGFLSKIMTEESFMGMMLISIFNIQYAVCFGTQK